MDGWECEMPTAELTDRPEQGHRDALLAPAAWHRMPAPKATPRDPAKTGQHVTNQRESLGELEAGTSATGTPREPFNH